MNNMEMELLLKSIGDIFFNFYGGVSKQKVDLVGVLELQLKN